MSKSISKTEAIKLIKGAGNKVFSVDFMKLNDEPRTINGRLGVTKGVKGKGSPNVKALGYIRVYEQHKPKSKVKPGFKLVNARTISGLRINGESYKVK